MNTKVFVISVRWKDVQAIRAETFEGQMASIIGAVAWMRFNSFAWLLKTNIFVTSQQVYTAVNLEAAGLDQILIAEINRATRAGWCPKWVWDWIDSDQPLAEGAPLLPAPRH